METKRLTKAARAKQQAQWDADRDATMDLHDRWYAELHNKAEVGTVLWFDRLAGEGMVSTPRGHWPVYACNLPGRKTLFPETACVYLNTGDTVEFTYQIDFANYHIKVSTPGIFDADKWAQLDHDKLAFRVRDDGTTTGLGINLWA